MGLLFNMVMATATKESKGCHGQTPSDKKRNCPERHGSSSRKSLNYLVSASQNDKENSKVTTLKHTLFFMIIFIILTFPLKGLGHDVSLSTKSVLSVIAHVNFLLSTISCMSRWA